jgi:sugar lactone lactonase YvrE
VSLAALALLASVGGVVVPGPAQAQRPETIDLPAGFQGEGVATGWQGTFYAGSRADGRIAIGNIRDATSDVFVSEPLVPAATGLKADLRHSLLWVAGAATGQAAVYDLETGDGIVALTLTTAEDTFVNDVVVTRDAAYFTDSRNPVIYRVPVSKRGEVGEPETITLSGPASEFEAGQFNLNGIEATADGRTLIAVNSFKGTLYTIDAESGDSAEIDLGGETVVTGDGILLHGRTLLVLQNGGGGVVPNQIAVVRLRHHLAQGTIVDTITSPLFETATTLARSGGTLLAVNAQFAPPPIDPEPEVVLLRRR